MLFAVFALAQSKFSVAINTQFGIHTGSFSEIPNAAAVNAHFENPFNFPPTIAYGGGLSFDYKLSKHWIGRTGISYLSTSTDIQEYNIYGGAYDLNTSFRNSKSGIYHQVQIPLSIIWQFNQSKYTPFLGGGILFSHFFPSNNISTVGLEQQTELTPEQNDTVQWMLNAGIRIQQKIGVELQYTFGTRKSVISYSEFLPFPCAVIAGQTPTGPCGNHLDAYSPSVFRSFLGLKISYYLLN